MTQPQGGPAPVDPKQLTPAQLNALRLADTGRLIRVRNGYVVRGDALVSLRVADALVGKGLARSAVVNAQKRLLPTGNGKNTLAVADARKNRNG